MKRKCNLIANSLDGKKAIYVDADNQAEILNYLRQDERHRKKFQFISDIILGGHRMSSVYGPEDVNTKAEDVMAMKFFKRQENDRIYCKEVRSRDKVYVVIMCVLHEKKKSEGVSKVELAIINKVGGYEYEI